MEATKTPEELKAELKAEKARTANEAEKRKEAKRKEHGKKKSLTFFFSLRLYDDDGNPRTDADGNPIDPANIADMLTTKQQDGGLDRWAIIVHDADKYDETDIKKRKRQATANFTEKHGPIKDLNDEDAQEYSDQIKAIEAIKGQPKPTHIHINLLFRRGSSGRVSTIAGKSWMNLDLKHDPDAIYLIQASNGAGTSRGGRNAFLECEEYMTHSNKRSIEEGKHRYPDEAMIVSDNNRDWRTEIEALNARKNVMGADGGTEADFLKYMVANMGMTPEEVHKSNPAEYIKIYASLKPLRRAYVEHVQPLPRWRENFYISGDSGAGKSWIAEALARQLYCRDNNIDPKDLPKDNRIFYTIGGKRVPVDNYDGQPVVIWDDCRPIDLLARFGYDRGELFKQLDKKPKEARINIKYGTVTLKNTYNIITSVTPWKEWIRGIASEYTDKEGNQHEAEEDQLAQMLRRLDAFYILHAEDYDLGLNISTIDRNYDANNAFLCVRLPGSIGRLAARIGDNRAGSVQGYKSIERDLHTVKDALPSSNAYHARQTEATDEEIAQYLEQWRDNPSEADKPDITRNQTEQAFRQIASHIKGASVYFDGINAPEPDSQQAEDIEDPPFDDDDAPIDWNHLF